LLYGLPLYWPRRRLTNRLHGLPLYWLPDAATVAALTPVDEHGDTLAEVGRLVK
jgi:hypothetical protein